jgi:hypothetical protein
VRRITRSKRGWIFAIVSSALHLAWALGLRELKYEPPRRDTTVEFSLVTQPAPAVPEQEPDQLPPPAAAPPSEPAATRAPQRRRDAPAKVSRIEQPTAAEAVPEEPAPSAVAGENPAAVAVAVPSEAPARPRTAPDLSPRRAAVASYDSLSNPPSVCNPPAADGGTCQPRSRDELAQDRLNQSLRQSARSLAHLATREPPVLHREADGGFRFQGHVFSAKIEPDGHVRFADAAAASIDGPATTSPGVSGSFDLNDAVQHAMGDELYTAEKRWFLDQTAELRGQLADAARARERAVGRRYLERELERILAARELDPTQKRARVFALWQDCGDDADSADARRIVEAFVRLRMPEGSALGFVPAELEHWNAARHGMRPFDPYHAPSAGSPG